MGFSVPHSRSREIAGGAKPTVSNERPICFGRNRPNAAVSFDDKFRIAASRYPTGEPLAAVLPAEPPFVVGALVCLFIPIKFAKTLNPVTALMQ